MGRRPLGKAPLTNAEKQARHRAKIRAELAGYRGGPPTPEGLARERFLNYVTKRLTGEYDTAAWEFWTWLFDQAKSHKVDHSGFGSSEFQKDRAASRARGGQGG